MENFWRAMKRKRIGERALSLFLAVVMLVCLLPTGLLGAATVSQNSGEQAGEEQPVSQAQETVSEGEEDVQTVDPPLLGNGNGTADLTGTVIQVNGKEITNGQTVKNGDRVNVRFNWKISNDDKAQKEYTIDLSTLILAGISLDNAVSEQDLLNENGQKVGTYKVQGGRIILDITDSEYLKEDGKNGYVMIGGIVNITDSSVEAGDKTKISISWGSIKKEYEVIYDDANSSSGLELSKSLSGEKRRGEDGSWYQTFKVRMNAYGGDVKNIRISDEMVEYLSFHSGIKVTASTVSAVYTGTEYATIADAASALNGVTMHAGESIEYTYEVKLDPGIYKSDRNSAGNHFQADYTDNKKKEQSKDAWAFVEVKKPELAKTGKMSADKKSIDWTITVKLNDYDDPSEADLKRLVSSVIDTPRAGLVGANIGIDITGNFVRQSDGSFVATYTTAIQNSYLESTGNYTFYNNVKVNTKDGGSFSQSGSVDKNGSGWLEKEVEGEAVDGVIPWKITFKDIPDGTKELAFSENTFYNNSAEHELLTIKVGDDLVYDSNGDEDTNNDWIDASAQKYFKKYSNWWVPYIEFKDSFIEQYYGKDLVIHVTSKFEGAPTKAVFNNQAEISYEQKGMDDGEKMFQDADASYSFLSNMEKEGKSVTGKNAIDYKVEAVLKDVDFEAGEVLTVTDTIPEGMEYVPGTASVKRGNWYYAQSEVSGAGTGEPEVKDGQLKWSITLSEADRQSIGKNKEEGIVFTYELKVTDEAAFVAKGSETFANMVSGKVGSLDLGKATDSTELTAQPVVKKTHEVSLPFVNYTVMVNEEELDLLPGTGTLTATDTMGSAILYKFDTMKVEQWNGSAYTELAKGTAYQYTFDAATNKLIITGLPDDKKLRITYTGRINLAGDQLNEENSSNRFEIDGISEKSGGANDNLDASSIEASGLAVSELGTFTIQKYWTDGGQMVALDGSEFKVTRYTYDEATDSMVPAECEGTALYAKDGVVEENIQVTKEGTVTVKGLNVDYIYSLIETKAKTGFKLADEPYYFVINGSTAKLPTKTSSKYYDKVKTFSNKVNILFPNEESEEKTGELTLTKTIAGVGNPEDVAKALAKITFVIRDSDYKTYKEIEGSKLTAQSDGTYTITIKDIEPGDYWITEKVTAPDGYTYDSTSYEIMVDGSETDSGVCTPDDDESFEVEKRKETQIHFSNTYKQTGALLIKKTTTGDLAWEKIADKVSFIVKKGSQTIATIAGTELTAANNYTCSIDGLESGTYTIEETGADVSGYTRKTTIAGKTANPATVTFNAATGQTAEVVNSYQREKGQLVLTKTFSGIGAEADIEKAAKGISFTIEPVSPTEGNVRIYDLVTANIAGVVSSTYDEDSKAYTLTVYNLPTGTYRVTETTSDLADYTLKSITYKVGTATGNGEVGGARFNVQKDKDSEVSFTNTYEELTGSLKLTKTVTGDLDWNKVKNSLIFTVTGTLRNGGTFTKKVIKPSKDKFKEDPAGSGTYVYELTGLYAGDYTIQETFQNETEGYTRTTTSSIGSVKSDALLKIIGFKADNTRSADFVNDYKQDLGKLVIHKEFNGLDWEELAKASDVSFQVTSEDGKYKETFTKEDFVKEADGTYKLTLEKLPVGIYTIVEKVLQEDGYSTTTKYQLAADRVTDGNEGNEIAVEVTKNDTQECAFSNTYAQTRGDLVLRKRVTGLEWVTVKGCLSFEITGENGRFHKTINGTDKGWNTPDSYGTTADGWSLDGLDYVFTIYDVPCDVYTIKENATDPSGAYLTSVSTRVNSEKAKSTSTATEKLSEQGETDTWLFTNTYAKKQYTFVLRKTVQGDREWEDVKKYLTFHVQIVNKNNAAEVVEKTIDGTDSGWKTNGSGDYYYEVNGLDGFAEGSQVTVWEKYKDSYAGSDLEKQYTTTAKVQIDSKDPEAYANGIEKKFIFNPPEGMTAKFTNTYSRDRGILRLEKSLSGIRTDELEDVTDQITFRVTPSPEKSGGAFATYKLKDFTLKNGIYSLEFADVPTGEYTVKESYELDGYVAKNVVYGLKADGDTVYITQTGGKENGAVAGVEKGKTTTLKVTDVYEDIPGELQITKKIIGNVPEALAKSGIVVCVTRVANGEKKEYPLSAFTHTDGTDTYTLKLSGQPRGGYIVEEVKYELAGFTFDGCKAGINGATPTESADRKAGINVEADKTVRVALENEYTEKEKDKGTLKITKTLKGDIDRDEAEGALEFTVENHTTGVTETYTLKDFTWDDASGIYTKVLTEEVGGYTVTESVHTIEGYTETVKYRIGSGEQKTDDKAEMTVEKDSESVVAFEDDYKKDSGKLIITKTLKGDVSKEEAEGALEFTVKNNTSNKTDTYTLKDFTKDNTTGIYTLELEAAAGGYTVTESVHAIEGYTETVKYQVGNEAQKTGESTTVTIGKGKTVTVAFEDDYKENSGKLVITKTIRGDVSKEEAEGALKFTVKNNTSNKTDTYTLKDFTKDTTTGIYTLELEATAGGYTVTESTHTIDGYAAIVKYQVDNEAWKTGYTTDIKITKDNTTTVAFEDTYIKKESIKEKGRLVIRKNITGVLSLKDAENAIKFHVKNNDTGEITEIALKDFAFDEKTGEYTIELEETTGGYTVTESVTDIKGYKTVSVKSAVNDAELTETKEVTVTIRKNTETTTKFEDQYSKTTDDGEEHDDDDGTDKKQDIKSGKLILTKTLKGDITGAEAEGTLEFKVTNRTTNEAKTYTLKDFTYSASNGKYTLELTQITDNYTVEESVYDVKGYKTVSVKYSINGAALTAGTKAEVSIPADSTVTVAFEDKYKETEEDNDEESAVLSITKTLSGDLPRDRAESVLRFKVTNNATKESDTYSLKDFTYNSNTGTYTLTLECVPGRYTVEEAVYHVEGYETVKVTYQIAGGSQITGTSANVKTAKNKTTSIAFKDEYKKKQSDNTQDKTTFTKTSKINVTDTSTRTSSGKTPKTGDDTPLMLYLVMLLLGAAGSGTGFAMAKRSRRKES